MALNDKSLKAQTGIDVYPGVANPTTSNMSSDPLANNFQQVEDPTSKELGAGAGANFQGDRDAKKAMRGASGVIEARPGIIEDTHIDPLSETSNKDDGWANATTSSGSNAPSATDTADSTLASAREVTAGAAKIVYGTATGKPTQVEEGKRAVFGKSD
ncbi:hypothetical protein K439DRAFT_1651151 [Ramaria rubella]|nr:hypothetical protein K439DRAFT_1651151 [Ramaria rubella]